MSWPADVRGRAQALIAKYPKPRSAVMPLLYLAMREDQGLTPDGMRQVADYTGLTPVQVESVASFYSMYKRDSVGDYIVSVCTSISCHLLGSDEVLEAVTEETGVPPGETGADGRFSVEGVECIGACGGAPAVQVNYELVEGVTPDSGRRLCRWLADDQPAVVSSDQMQAEFGGTRSFEWGPDEPEGAIGPVPAFGPYGTAGRHS
jgi:NADH:ubiquinone oxidoreductase subunit E